MKYAKRLNGLTGISVNHLDTIGKFDKIKVCVAYDCTACRTEDFSTNLKFLQSCKPVYKEFDGNFGDLSGCKTFRGYPGERKGIYQLLEEYTKTPVKFIGTGAGREAMIVRL